MWPSSLVIFSSPGFHSTIWERYWLYSAHYLTSFLYCVVNWKVHTHTALTNVITMSFSVELSSPDLRGVVAQDSDIVAREDCAK